MHVNEIHAKPLFEQCNDRQPTASTDEEGDSSTYEDGHTGVCISLREIKLQATVIMILNQNESMDCFVVQLYKMELLNEYD